MDEIGEFMSGDHDRIDGALDPAEKEEILRTFKEARGGQCHDAQNIA